MNKTQHTFFLAAHKLIPVSRFEQVKKSLLELFRNTLEEDHGKLGVDRRLKNESIGTLITQYVV